MTTLADNEQWLADNREKTVHAAKRDGATLAGEETPAAEDQLAADEEHILRCLGAALIMRWNTLPRELQRELFDDAGATGAASNATALRAQIARFLHRHKDDEDEVAGGASQ